jgi:hypothetical protein
MRAPTKCEIALALGISGAAFSRYVKRGCPVWSVSAALAWQAQHVHPWQRVTRSRAAQTALADAAAGKVAAVRALAALAADDFDAYAARLRAAMRAVPPAARHKVQLDLDVFRRLLPVATSRVIEADDNAVVQSDADARAVGEVLYQVACGERSVTP